MKPPVITDPTDLFFSKNILHKYVCLYYNHAYLVGAIRTKVAKQDTIEPSVHAKSINSVIIWSKFGNCRLTLTFMSNLRQISVRFFVSLFTKMTKHKNDTTTNKRKQDMIVTKIN